MGRLIFPKEMVSLTFNFREGSLTQTSHNSLFPKLITINAPEPFMHEMTKLYVKECPYYYENKRPHFSFAYNIDRPITPELRAFALVNKLLVHSYSLSNVKMMQMLMGYRFVLYFGLFDELYPSYTNNDFIKKFEQIVQRYALNQSSLFIVLPDLIFQPSNQSYDEESEANTKSDNRIIAYYKLISQMIDFYKNVLKYSIHKIIVPFVLDDKKIIAETLSKRILKSPLKNSDTNTPLRSLITFKELSEAIMAIYKNEMLPEDYMIASDNYVDETQLKKYLKHVVKDIEIYDFSHELFDGSHPFKFDLDIEHLKYGDYINRDKIVLNNSKVKVLGWKPYDKIELQSILQKARIDKTE